MRVLIVDDDDNKRRQLCRVVKDCVPVAVLTEARSYQSGLRSLLASAYDLVILDMTMPSFDVTADDDGGRTQAFAGRDLLRQMDVRGIRSPVIVVTQFDRFGGESGITLAELHDQLIRAYSDSYIGSIFFDIATPRWRHQLSELVDKFARSRS